ncbi:MAG: hypothetical protein H6719_13485 [Sandaracinaceae bacterium]|nr:hypothetical protein [Sandaracinaceae bacterium]
MAVNREELESSPEGLGRLRAPGPAHTKVGALYDYWIDYANAWLDDDRDLLVRALEATVALAATHAVAEPWSVDEDEALSRAFVALHQRRPIVEAALGRDSVLDAGAALVRAVDRLRAAARSPSRPVWAWLELAVSVVTVWPEHAGAIVERLATPTPDAWRAWVPLVARLAFPTGEGPFFTGPLRPWRRFGDDRGLAWSAADADALDRALEAGLRAGLRASVAWAPPEDRAAVAGLADDVEQFLWDGDLRRRRGVWVAQLASTAPVDYWPDEHGVVGPPTL